MDTQLAKNNEIAELIAATQNFNINDEPIGDAVPAVSDFNCKKELSSGDYSFFKVTKLAFDEDFPKREAFENVLLSLDNTAFNFVYILEGNENGVDLYIGIVNNGKKSSNKFASNDYTKIIQSTFEGNFNGSILMPLRKSTDPSKDNKELEKIVNNCNYKNAGVIMGIPSLNDDKNNESKGDFQGVDRLINSMLGLKWRIVIVCEPVNKSDVKALQEQVYNLYNEMSVLSKMNVQNQVNQSSGRSYSENEGHSENTSHGTSYNDNITKGTNKSSGGSDSSSGTSKSRSEGHGTSDTTGSSDSKGKTAGVSQNNGSSTSLSFELTNKRMQEIMSYIDNELLGRLKTGFTKGLYRTAFYYMAEKPVHAARLKNGIMSLFQGNGSSFSPLISRELSNDVIKNTNILSLYQNFCEKVENCPAAVPTLFGRPFENDLLGLSTYLTPREISLIAGLPQKEVPGIVLQESVDFGLNQKNIAASDENIELGSMVQKGRKLENVPFYLKKESLSKHTFIAGVTGSGKTTTCHKLLAEANVPYLVIEPAKTEYRTLINYDADIFVLTIGSERVAPFRFNPFELVKGELLPAHIDMLKATFTSAFPMEGSMPQLMEEAIIQAYENKGWDTSTGENSIYDDPYTDDADAFPVMTDLLCTMKKVVAEKNFGERLQGEYEGSLISRLSNLTKGVKGRILNCRHSVDFNFIADSKVILEMDELKSPEDKALFMGFILTRLSAVVKYKHKLNKDYRHLTLVEEAHRLLSKPDYGDPGSKKAAVETFADMLAEVRKYGEGLIIVDQIPNKLASEVLKNTNTKIIHKILAKDDKEAVGDTMLMNPKQKEFLSALPVGEAVIFTENTDKPVNVAIKPIDRDGDTNEAEIDDETVTERFKAVKSGLGRLCYDDPEIQAIYPTFIEELKNLKKLMSDSEKRKKIVDTIGMISEKKRKPASELWKKLIENRLTEKGNSASDPDCMITADDVNRLVTFFAEEYSVENYSVGTPEPKLFILIDNLSRK